MVRDSNITVYLQDNKGLPQVKDHSIDLVVTDSPFGIKFGKKRASNYNRIEDCIEGYVEINNNYKEFTTQKMLDIKRVLKDNGVVFWWCACVQARDLSEDRLLTVLEGVRDAGFYRYRDIIWGYPFGVWNPNGFTISHQHILMLTKEPKVKFTWNGHYEEDAVWIKRHYNKGLKTNMTETNEELIRWLISLCSNKGDLILDPFFGSGTVGKVCYELGRNCIGYEINKLAIDRIMEKIPTITTSFQ